MRKPSLDRLAAASDEETGAIEALRNPMVSYPKTEVTDISE